MKKDYIKEMMDSINSLEGSPNSIESILPKLEVDPKPSLYKTYDINQAATAWVDMVLADLPLIREPL